jgi:hypothetical protein
MQIIAPVLSHASVWQQNRQRCCPVRQSDLNNRTLRALGSILGPAQNRRVSPQFNNIVLCAPSFSPYGSWVASPPRRFAVSPFRRHANTPTRRLASAPSRKRSSRIPQGSAGRLKPNYGLAVISECRLIVPFKERSLDWDEDPARIWYLPGRASHLCMSVLKYANERWFNVSVTVLDSCGFNETFSKPFNSLIGRLIVGFSCPT